MPFRGSSEPVPVDEDTEPPSSPTTAGGADGIDSASSPPVAGPTAPSMGGQEDGTTPQAG